MKGLNLPYEPFIIADTYYLRNKRKYRLTSYQLSIPTCLLAELRTHRLFRYGDSDFSINANSDRAIPISKKIDNVLKKPYLPIVTLKNKGMTAIEDNIDEVLEKKIIEEYSYSMSKAINSVKNLDSLGASKQFVNRLLMPFSYSDVIITGDNECFNNFFSLRTTIDTEPNFRYIANIMLNEYKTNKPKRSDYHIAFEKDIDNQFPNLSLDLKVKVSMSMCARISYDNENIESLEKHIERTDRCLKNKHMSIAEHQAIPLNHFNYKCDKELRSLCKNLNGFVTFRALYENSINLNQLRYRYL